MLDVVSEYTIGGYIYDLHSVTSSSAISLSGQHENLIHKCHSRKSSMELSLLEGMPPPGETRLVAWTSLSQMTSELLVNSDIEQTVRFVTDVVL